jgi:superfamily I DNA/RNA helicase
MLDLSRLNPPQREAVTAPDGPLLVLAGAGSGKTRVIAHRVAWLLGRGLSPESILAVTFTNRSAAEMRERVASLVGRAGGAVRVSTFHAFGLHLLREEHRAAGLPRRFAVADAGDQLALVRRCLAELSVDGRRFDALRVQALVSRAKNAGQRRIVPRPALAYVGITRARERLVLTRALARTRRGKLLARTPSRFLDDLPPGAHERVEQGALEAPPGEVAAHTASVMAGLRARLAGGLAGADGNG